MSKIAEKQRLLQKELDWLSKVQEVYPEASVENGLILAEIKPTELVIVGDRVFGKTELQYKNVTYTGSSIYHGESLSHSGIVPVSVSTDKLLDKFKSAHPDAYKLLVETYEKCAEIDLSDCLCKRSFDYPIVEL